MTNPAPRRAYTVTIDLHADSLSAIGDALYAIADDIESGLRQAPFDITGAGSHSGYVVLAKHDPSMTPERYQAELQAWCAADRLRRAATQPQGDDTVVSPTGRGDGHCSAHCVFGSHAECGGYCHRCPEKCQCSCHARTAGESRCPD